MTHKKEMDRVCLMWIEKGTASFTSQYHGDTCYFCSKECKEQFDQDPERYMAFERRNL
jgi:YHS domain-containing protein